LLIWKSRLGRVPSLFLSFCLSSIVPGTGVVLYSLPASSVRIMMTS
jgi:hypothetical protein